jgi:hypothetical protein
LANVAGSARASAGEVEAFVAPVVPVVDQPVELRLFDATVTEPEIPFSILQEGREVFRGTAAVSNGQATAEWTPQETGFYTARFESGGGRSAEREFPVVWTDLYFTTWGVLWPEEIRRIKYVHSHAIIAGDKNKRPMSESIPMLRKRGAKLIHFTSGSHRVPPGPMDDETIARLVAGWSAPIKNGFDGIFMDELGEWPTPELIEKLKGTHRALVRLRAENPEMIIMPANGGALLREEGAMYREAGAVALLQTYPTCFTRYMASHSIEEHIDHRIMVARNTDLIQYGKNKNTALVLLGTHVDAPHEEPIEPELEGYVRYIKKKAPEMRGIAFYGGRHGTMIETQDRLCLEYYIKPVVDVRAIRFSNYSPRTGQPVDVLMQVHNLGGMTARKIKAKVYASRLGEGKRTRIGEIDIEKIGCGYHDLEYRGEEGDPAPEFQEIDGNRYAVYPGGYNTVFLPRTTRSVTWVPKKKGYYQVVVEIEPSATDQYTLLDGARVEPILVR